MAAIVVSMASAVSNGSKRAPQFQPVTEAEAEEAVHLPEFVSLVNYSQFLMAMESDHTIASGSRQAAEALSAKFADLRDASSVSFLQAVVAADRPAPELADVIADPKPALKIVELASIDPETVLEVKEISLRALGSAPGPRANIVGSVVRQKIPMRPARSLAYVRTSRGVKLALRVPTAITGSDASLESSLVGRLRDTANARPAEETSSVAPLTSHCGNMTPECRSNRAWCGC